MTEPVVRLVYQRTSPPGEDAGVEPLIAVCVTEEEAEKVKTESSSQGHYVSWEEHPLQGAEAWETPLAGGLMVHAVLQGGNGAEQAGEDPIGIAVYAGLETAEQRADEERRLNQDPGCHAVSFPVGWRGKYGGRF